MKATLIRPQIWAMIAATILFILIATVFHRPTSAEENDTRTEQVFFFDTESLNDPFRDALPYAAGILDTLAIIQSSGKIDPHLLSCLFNNFAYDPLERKQATGMASSMMVSRLEYRNEKDFPPVSGAQAFLERAALFCKTPPYPAEELEELTRGSSEKKP